MENNNSQHDKFDLSKDMFSLSEVWAGVKRLTNSSLFPKFYLLFSLLTLASTTFIWSLLGARLQNSNSDQLSNAYLFKSSAIFHAATMPDQHTFILKWPIFLLIRLFGYSRASFITFTVLIAMATVASLAYLLYRIERRKLVFGTLCLALASVLLLVPTMPYAGGILPVNMAMITTRNIEYILYILSMVLILQNIKNKTKLLWAGVGILTILIASDKLFMTLSLAGALASLVVYALLKRRLLFSKSIVWFIGSLTASMLAMFILSVLNIAQVTNIASTTLAGPYGLVTSLHQVLIGGLYAVMGIFTNFGANPAYDSLTIRQIPHLAITRLLSVNGLSYVVNGLIMLAAFWAVMQLVKKATNHNIADEYLAHTDRVTTLMLIWSSVTAIAAFIFTNHYYPVDARYLTIILFTGFVALAIMLSSMRIQFEKLLPISFIILISITVGTFSAVHTYDSQKTALRTIDSRNHIVAQILSTHHVGTLVGDYWRTLPIELLSANQVKVSPLSGCTVEREILNSSAYKANLTKSFAYLLTLDKGLTDYPSCTLATIVKTYGRPNASAVIDGTLKNPKELLLFYDSGINKKGLGQILKVLSTVLPIPINNILNKTCLTTTNINIVAHEDDDLLFMNPDILRDIEQGRCIRTVYLTAGDAGSNKFYWLSRQQGLETAYSFMNGTPNDIWIERIVEIANNQFITIANPRGNTKLSLIFFHLPDGNLVGQGFKSDDFESLQKLYFKRISIIHSVDGQSVFSLQDIINDLAKLMSTYDVTGVRTQAKYLNQTFPDHSDHLTTGRIASKAYAIYRQQSGSMKVMPITYYIGYPIRTLPINVTGTYLDKKRATFFLYSKFDGGVCISVEQCSTVQTYSSYLKRQYQNPY